MEIYRFRSMKYLLGEKYQELERQSIYFANPDELNDPMEGFRDIVWKGDKIVWTNLFKHYVYCLYSIYLQFLAASHFVRLDADKIPILGRWDKLPSPAQRMFNEILHGFLNLPKVPEIIEALANADYKFRYRELRLCLSVIHSVVLDEIDEVYFANGHMSESGILHPPEGLPTAEKTLESILAAITQIEEGQDKEKANAVFRMIEEMNSGTRISLQLNNVIPKGILGKNIQLMIYDFPAIYLREIEGLLWFNWRPACFTKSCHNSSVWGSYGDKHKGACLIFESVKIDGSHQLGLSEGAGKGIPASKFREVVYGDKPHKVDFFRSIGRSTVEQLRELWYTDAEGNFSECAAHMPRDGEIDNDDTIAWRKKYWDSFYRDITTKTKDWGYEQEWRLILEDRPSKFDKQKNRTLKYNFNSLKGIIFGIKTLDEHRSRIIEIIQEKCEKYERRDFTFYQAYYSQETGDIRKHKINLS